MVTTRSQARKAEAASLAVQSTTKKDNQDAQPPTLAATFAIEISPDVTMEGEVPPPKQSKEEEEEEEEVFDNITTVQDFCTIIETVPVDKWRKRTAALDSLLDNLIVSGVEDDPQLSNMAPAISTLLKDPRSTVVKQTCAALNKFFPNYKATNRGCANDLWIGIFPTILEIASLTSGVIRNLVQDMVVHCLPTASTCPRIISMILERLSDPKCNKSKTVREACVLYLSLAVEFWTPLNKNILETAGNTLIGAMRDATPSVRERARRGIEVLRRNHAELWKALVLNKPKDGPSRDLKLQKLLERSLKEPEKSLENLSSSCPSTGVRGKSKFSKFRSFQKQQNGNAGAANFNDENMRQNNGTTAHCSSFLVL